MSERNLATFETQVSAMRITLHLMAYLQRCGLEWTKFYVVLHTYAIALSVTTARKVDVSTHAWEVLRTRQIFINICGT